tara:strand:+ start:24726 stop:25364 length:639 start_codon:yes stop_codon:yes gene_type:complete
MSNKNLIFPVTLYHGTSSLFLDSIVKNGLGGVNPIDEWKVHEFATRIYPLIESHLSNRDDLVHSIYSYGQMVNQKAGKSMNFQHGDTYISASKYTTVNYALSNTHGSELLSYSLRFLSELVGVNVEVVTDVIYKEFPHMFNLLELKPTPILLEINKVNSSTLLAEDGSSAKDNISMINNIIRDYPEKYELMLQQTNFRLNQAIPVVLISMQN